MASLTFQDVGACNCGTVTTCLCTGGAPTTLTYTHSVLGSCTITYTTIPTPQWTGTINYAYPGGPRMGGGAPCAPVTIPINITFDPTSCDVTINWHTTAGCPTVSGSSNVFNQTFTSGATLLSRTVTCSPFSLILDFSGANSGSVPSLWGTAAFNETVS